MDISFQSIAKTSRTGEHRFKDRSHVNQVRQLLGYCGFKSGVLEPALDLFGRDVVALGAWAVGWLESLKPLAQYARAFEVFGGIALIAAGLYLLNAYFFWIPALAG